MDVTIIGAGDTIGRQVAITIVQEHIVPVTSRLQLVSHRGGASEQPVLGSMADLADAYAERSSPASRWPCPSGEVLVDIRSTHPAPLAGP